MRSKVVGHLLPYSNVVCGIEGFQNMKRIHMHESVWCYIYIIRFLRAQDTSRHE